MLASQACPDVFVPHELDFATTVAQPVTMFDSNSADLILHTSNGTLGRTVRVTSGYASGDPSCIHFGFPRTTGLTRLDVRWPDGAISFIGDLTPNKVLTVMRR